MSIPTVLLPVFVLIALTFGLLGWGGRTRVRALKNRELKMSDIALGQAAWPERPTQITRAFQNQLELPVLFYVLVGFALLTHKADLLFVVMSWIFVVLRLAHAYVHTTNNFVPRRFAIFVAGYVMLILLWLIFAVRILAGI